MAEKRMFSQKVVMSDAFLDMELSTRCLYYTFGMVADDDGFVGNPRVIMRVCGATKEDFNELLSKRYILEFPSGVIVIKHWRMNNYIQKDRYKPTSYLEELATLEIDARGAYTEKKDPVYKMDTKCIQTVYSDSEPLIQLDIDQQDNNEESRNNADNSAFNDGSLTDAQGSVYKMYTNCIQNGYADKNSIDKNRLDKDSIESAREENKIALGIYHNVYLTKGELNDLMAQYPNEYKDMIENLSTYMRSKGKYYDDHYATIMKWARNDKQKANDKEAEREKFKKAAGKWQGGEARSYSSDFYKELEADMLKGGIT